jgi:raffinose/stachyose/melibiose transport system permease protein
VTAQGFSSSTRRRTRVRRRRIVRRWPGVLFVTPAVAITGTFLAYPIFKTIRLSFTDWDGLSVVQRGVGLANYGELFHRDPYFWHAARNTALWVAVTVPAQLLIGLTLALLLDRRLRFKIGYRTIFFIPAVLSPVAIGLSWNSLYTPGRGAASELLGLFGFNTHHGLLGNPSRALLAVMIADIWRYAGLIMVFYLAALQSIPASLYEAARVDGASEWGQIRRITIPLLKPMTLLLMLLATIAALREFDLVYILTGGGPAHASELLSIQIFQQGFDFSRVGYSCAIATVMLAATAVAALVQLGYLARTQRALAA